MSKLPAQGLEGSNEGDREFLIVSGHPHQQQHPPSRRHETGPLTPLKTSSCPDSDSGAVRSRYMKSASVFGEPFLDAEIL
jgi:hypothetical protein